MLHLLGMLAVAVGAAFLVMWAQGSPVLNSTPPLDPVLGIFLVSGGMAGLTYRSPPQMNVPAIRKTK